MDISPEMVRNIIRLTYSDHGLFPSFLYWELGVPSEEFSRNVARLAIDAGFLWRIESALRKIFADGFGHCKSSVCGVVISMAVLAELSKR